ncbi:hypothetical protein ACFPMF_13815 [Larkinella bovis]|uniref:Glycosyltransferase RgtA/B/C/D-like domain-containing protein n=1 Tax=Larkinella bovis TaxID=683041 RepID=A0ABW0IE52_9BACT
MQKVSPALILAPIASFLLLLFRYTENVPFMDDLESFVGFLVRYTEAGSLAEKVRWTLAPNNEHRILFAKLVTLFFYKLTGILNFRWLIWTAFCCLAGILFIFYRVFRTIRVPLIAFLPVALILLQPQHRMTSFWAITALQHLPVAMMILWAMYWLAVSNRSATFSARFGGALLLQILASLSMSNGLFGWAAGVGVLLVQWRLEGSSYLKRLIVWVGVAIIVVLFYFHDFANLQGNGSSLTFFLQHPHLVFFGFFTFLGGSFDFFPTADILKRSLLPTLAGLVLVAALYGLFKATLLPSLWQPHQKPADRQQRQRRYFFVGVYGFLLVNAVVVAVLRPRFGYGVMLVGNYMLYPALFVVTLYLTALSEFGSPERRRRLMRVGLSVGGLIWTVMYFNHLPRLAEQKLTWGVSAFNQKYNDVGFGAELGSPYGLAVKEWMSKVVQKGIYSYPSRTFYSPYEQTLQGPVSAADSAFHLVITESAGEFQVVTSDWALPAGIQNACIVVKSDRHTYLFPADNLFLPRHFYLRRRMPNVSARVFKATLYPGTYQVGLFVSAAGETDIRFSNQYIKVL